MVDASAVFWVQAGEKRGALKAVDGSKKAKSSMGDGTLSKGKLPAKSIKNQFPR
jgi:hypothetical protein